MNGGKLAGTDDASVDQGKLAQTKEGFLNLCAQYAHLGGLLNLQSEAFSKADDKAPAVLEKILTQYQEIGEQLKAIGTGLDSLGGSPVLLPQDLEKN